MDSKRISDAIDKMDTAKDLLIWVLENYDCSKKMSMLDKAGLKNYLPKIIAVMGIKEKS